MQYFFNSAQISLLPLKKLCLLEAKVNWSLEKKQNQLEAEVKLLAFSERKKLK